MKKIKLLFVFLVSFGFANAQQTPVYNEVQQFKKDKEGTEYKLIRSPNGKKAVVGEYMEVNILSKYKDSVLFSSDESSTPRFIPYDTAQMPPYFKDIHEGDILVIRESTNSIISHGAAAPFMQKGQFIVETFKIVKLFPNKESADNAEQPYLTAAKVIGRKKTEEKIEEEMNSHPALVKADDEAIKDYMAKNNLKGTRTDWGTYVVIDSAGTGSKIGNNDVAVVDYTGRTFSYSIFDSNTDANFNHLQPLYVDMSEYSVIPGWIDGLKMMQKGTKGKLIVPSYLAYGASGRPPKIAPNSNLIFDIKVTDVVDQAQYQREMMKQKQQMEMERKMMQQKQGYQAPPSGK